MIDHINLPVSDLEQAKKFYVDALGPLGYGILMEDEGHCGVGPRDGGNKWIGTLWLHETGDFAPLHVAFRVPRRDLVSRFHEAALAAGGRDNGAPGLRSHYHANYFAAFIIDPDGHNLEAVCHEGVSPWAGIDPCNIN